MAAPIIITTFCGSRRTRTRLVSWDDRNTERGHGQEGDAGDEWREPLDVLEELGEEEEHAVHPGVEQSPGDVGGAAGGMGEQPQREDRLFGPALVADEEAQQDALRATSDTMASGLLQPSLPASTRPKTMPVMPSVEVTAPVRSNRPPASVGLDDDDSGREPDDQTDGDVDEHDPSPRDELGEEAAGHQPGGAAGGRHRGVEADGPHPSPGLRRRPS